MKNQKRLFALLMCIGLVLTMIVSSAYIVMNAEHDCTGHDCDICEHMAEVRALLKGTSLLGLLASLFIMSAAVCQHIHACNEVCLHAQMTLVGWKVRLNN